jgi:hypothetical protein
VIIKNEILYQADFFHGYYPDNRTDCLTFEPTEACAAILQEHRLKFKNTGTGFIIVAEKILDSGVWKQLVPIVTGTCLHFYIYQRCDDLLNVTDADIRKYSGGGKYFFRNNGSMAAADHLPEYSAFTLFNNTTLSDSLFVAGTLFNAPIAISLDPNKLVLRDADDNIVAEKIIERNSNNEIYYSSLTFADTPLPENIYKLQQVDAANAVIAEDRYFLAGGQYRPGIAGVFQIQHNAVVEASAGREKHFVVNLAPRKIKWSYRVQVEQYTNPMEALNNYDINDLEIDASGPALGLFNAVIAPAGIVTFTSASLINIRKKPYDNIKLQDKGPPVKVVMPNLPNPDPLLMKDIGGGVYQSEIALKIK